MRNRKQNKCLVCNSEKTINLFMAANSHGSVVYSESKHFEYDRCLNCSAVFLVGVIPNKKYYKNFYSDSYRDENNNSGIASHIVNYSNTVKNHLIKKYVASDNSKKRILDIGSGTGNFLAQLPHEHYEKWGVEIDPKIMTSYKKLGITSVNEDFLTFDFGKQKFECITMWHVIEHIHDPLKLVKKVKNLLSKNGIFIFSTPNTDCIGFEKGKEHWFHLDAPRHFVLYNTQSLEKLAIENEFKVIETRNNWHDFPMDLFWSVRHSRSKYAFYLLYPIFKFIDRETITYVWRKSA